MRKLAERLVSLNLAYAAAPRAEDDIRRISEALKPDGENGAGVPELVAASEGACTLRRRLDRRIRAVDTERGPR